MLGKFLCSMMLFMGLIGISNQFFIQIGLNDKKCFLMMVFPQENLLLEIELPMITQKVQIMISVNTENGQIFNKTLQKSADRITVDMNNSPKPGSIYELQTCIETSLQQKSDKKYLIWMTHVTNFKHQINKGKNKIQSIPSSSEIRKDKEQHIKEVLDKTVRTYDLYREQIELYRINEKKEQQNERQLQKMEGRIMIITIIEMASIVILTLAYVVILSKML